MERRSFFDGIPATIAAPFVPGFGQVPAFLWNHIIIGLILMITGIWAVLTRDVRTARKLANRISPSNPSPKNPWYTLHQEPTRWIERTSLPSYASGRRI
jgi:hypothetical protein